jgi:peptide/nickel transport system permease protein
VKRLIAERLAHLLLVLWVVATLTFLLFRLMPGDPTLNFLSPTFTDEMRAALLKSFGLDKPLWQQYLIYLGQLLRGDFGQSFLQHQPVSAILWAALPNTVILTLVSLCLAYAFGIVAGAFLAFRRGALVEAVAIPVALATRAAPEFWVGMLLLAFVAFQLGWFPTGGAVSPGATLGTIGQRLLSADFWRHLCLPVLTLTLFLQGLPLLLMRATMLEVLADEFIVMARMKGLSRWSIVMRHAARNALLPVVTAFALGLGASIGGNVVIETVFAWPGIGRVLVQAVQGADYPVAQGAFIIIAFLLVVMNTVADLAYAWLDPRVSVGVSAGARR